MTILAPSNTKQIPFALAAEIDWGLGRTPGEYDGYSYSDYPDDAEIARAFIDPGENGFAVWADVELTMDSARQIVLYTQSFQRHTIWTTYPILPPGRHFMEQADRSWSWFQDFERRCVLHSNLMAKGGVHLLAPPEGPAPDCEDWYRREYPQLRAVQAVEWIDLISIYTLRRVRRYWTRGDPEPDSDDPESPDSPSGDGGNIINGGAENPGIDSVLGTGTAILEGDGPAAAAAAVLESLPPAVLSTGTTDAGLFLNGLKGSTATPPIPPTAPPSTTPPDQQTDVIEHPNHLGDGWQANMPSALFENQAAVPPDDTSNPFGMSQGTTLRPRGLGSTCSRCCSLRSGWTILAAYLRDASPRSSNGGPLFRISLDALRPPVGPLYNLLSSPFRGGVLMVNVIQTCLQQEAEAGTCNLDVTVLDGSNQRIASQDDNVDDSLEFRVEIPNLQTSLFLSWTGPQGSGPIHFRYDGAVGQSWDSTDTSKCRTDPYVDGERHVSCTFTTGTK